MTSKESAYLRRKWGKWLKIIGRDLGNLLISKDIFDEIRRLAGFNKQIMSPSLFYNWLVNNYIHSITIGIRRLNDCNEKSISLYRLIEDISENRGAITRYYYVSRYCKWMREKGIADSHFDKFSNKNDNLIGVHKLEGDKIRLKKDADCIRVFVNKWVAHCDIRRKRFRVPTYKDVDNTLINIDKLFCKYHMLLTRAGMNTCKPSLLLGWKEPLRCAWIKGK